MATKQQSPTEEALIEAAIAAIQENPGSVPVETLRSLVDETGFSREDMIGKAFEVHPDDYIPVYSTFDGNASWIPTSMLKTVLRKKFTRDHEVPPGLVGRLAFSLEQKVKPKVGTLKCMLHPEHPLREYYDSLGLQNRICMKANIPDEFNLRLHNMHRHENAWAIVTEAEARRQYEERQTYERAVMEHLLSLQTAQQEPKRGPGRPPKVEEE